MNEVTEEGLIFIDNAVNQTINDPSSQESIAMTEEIQKNAIALQYLTTYLNRINEPAKISIALALMRNYLKLHCNYITEKEILDFLLQILDFVSSNLPNINIQESECNIIAEIIAFSLRIYSENTAFTDISILDQIFERITSENAIIQSICFKILKEFIYASKEQKNILTDYENIKYKTNFIKNFVPKLLDIAIPYTKDRHFPGITDILKIISLLIRFNKSNISDTKDYTILPFIYYEKIAPCIKSFWNIIKQGVNEPTNISFRILNQLLSCPCNDLFISNIFPKFIIYYTKEIQVYLSEANSHIFDYQISKMLYKLSKILPLEKFITNQSSKAFFDSVSGFTHLAFSSLNFQDSLITDISNILIKFWAMIAKSSCEKKISLLSDHISRVFLHYIEVIQLRFVPGNQICNLLVYNPESLVENFQMLFLILQMHPNKISFFNQKIGFLISNLQQAKSVEITSIQISVFILMIASRFSIKETKEFSILSKTQDETHDNFKIALIQIITDIIKTVQPIIPQMQLKFEIYASYLVSSLLCFIHESINDIAALCNNSMHQVFIDFLMNLTEYYKTSGIVVYKTVKLLVDASKLIKNETLEKLVNCQIQLKIDPRVDFMHCKKIRYLLMKTYIEHVTNKQQLKKYLDKLDQMFGSLTKNNWEDKNESILHIIRLLGIIDGCKTPIIYWEINNWIISRHFISLLDLFKIAANDSSATAILELIEKILITKPKILAFKPTSIEVFQMMNAQFNFAKILLESNNIDAVKYILQYLKYNTQNYFVTNMFADSSREFLVAQFFQLIQTDFEFTSDVAISILDIFKIIRSTFTPYLHENEINYDVMINFIIRLLESDYENFLDMMSFIEFLGEIAMQASDSNDEAVIFKLRRPFALSISQFICSPSNYASMFKNFMFFMTINQYELVYSILENYFVSYEGRNALIQETMNQFIEYLANVRNTTIEQSQANNITIARPTPEFYSSLMEFKQRITKFPFLQHTKTDIMQELNDEYAKHQEVVFIET